MAPYGRGRSGGLPSRMGEEVEHWERGGDGLANQHSPHTSLPVGGEASDEEPTILPTLPSATALFTLEQSFPSLHAVASERLLDLAAGAFGGLMQRN